METQYKSFCIVNNQGLRATVHFIESKKWYVHFHDSGSTRIDRKENILLGKTRDLYHPSRYGVGYDGDIVRVHYWRRAKELWSNMLKRCYSDATSARNSTYLGKVTVSARWLCFANFLSDLPTLDNFDKWLSRDGKWELDKDTIIPGNTVYSVERCMFLDKFTNAAAWCRGKRKVDGQWVTTTD